MPVFAPQDLAAWSGGIWNQIPEAVIRSVSHDTRRLQPGAIYVALPGERVDGHDFIGSAMQAGAVAALCRTGSTDPNFPCLEVPDTGMALQMIARGYRQNLRPKQMIGVTGSAGKTTVKDILTAMLSAAGTTRSTPGNWNNFVGLPLSLLAMEPTDRYGVFELGMSRAGEIAGLADILRPEMGLITSIGEAHLEQLGSVEAIAVEKSSLLSALPAGGLAILDADSEWYPLLMERCACRTVRVSMREEADYEGEKIDGGIRILDRQRSEIFELALPSPGEHMLTNMLQAVAVARECGLSVTQITDGLEKYAPAPMRWQTVNLKRWTVINDAYNANPLSMRKSVRTFSELDHPGEKWLVLGGMAELGEAEKELHWVIGRELDGLGFDGVVLVGEKGAWIAEGISRTPVVTADSHSQAVGELLHRVPPDAILLLKGSRSEKLEIILKDLQNNEENQV